MCCTLGNSQTQMKSKLRENAYAHRWSILLTLLAFTVLFDSIAEDGFLSDTVSRFMYVVIFSGTILASTLSLRIQKLALAIVLIWPLIVISDDVFDTSVTSSAEILVLIIILCGALLILFRELTRDDGPDAIAGAIFGYFLIALAFALFYVRLEVAHPGTFNFGESDQHVSSLVYFSLVTITTLGFGDITPVTRFARIVVGIEAATGLMYVAVFIGRLVSRQR